MRYEKEKQELQIMLDKKHELLNKSNGELALLSAEIEKIRERLKDSKSEKEMKNLGMEEDILREKTTSFNDEIALFENAQEAPVLIPLNVKLETSIR